jgi:hypothetical protein
MLWLMDNTTKLIYAPKQFRAKDLAHFEPSNFPYQKLSEGVWVTAFF